MLRSDRTVINTIRTLKRNVRELKTPQKSGADVINVYSPGSITFGPYLIAAGAADGAGISYAPTGAGIRSLFNFVVSVSVDNFENNPTRPNYTFPFGQLLTSGQKLLTLMQWNDYFGNSGEPNSLAQYIWVRNEDTVSHNYYFYVQCFYIDGALS